jgi:hypothetical protein
LIKIHPENPTYWVQYLVIISTAVIQKARVGDKKTKNNRLVANLQ